MGYTITEKILMKHAGKSSIKPGDFINAKVDICLGNDVTAPIAIKEFKKVGAKKVFNKNRVVLIPDHFAPNKDIKSAQQCRKLKLFADEQKLKHYYEIGRMGIEHALLPERGIVTSGQVIIGADSHTCTYGALGAFSTGIGSTDLAACFVTGKCWFKVPETIKFIYTGKLPKWVMGKDLILYTIGDIGVDGALYKAMEFSGPVIRRLSMDDRFSMTNMAIEAGGKSGIIEPDEITKEYIQAAGCRIQDAGYRMQDTSCKIQDTSCKIQDTSLRDKKKLKTDKAIFYKSDPDAIYSDICEYNVTDMEPQVACPHLPSNVKSVSKLKRVKVDQVVIGSCTNGRITDLRAAAKVLKNKKVHKDVRCIVIPATQKIYLQAVKEGLVEIFVKAEAVVSTPTCGPCLGGHMGILSEGEVAIATTNRNFVGRMGHLKSFVYLSNPYVAAASAVKGRIAHPEEVI